MSENSKSRIASRGTEGAPPLGREFRAALRPTTIIESARLAKRLAVSVVIASETFQHTGSFKFRAAYNVALSVPQEILITASSGNFGQGLAYACALLKKSCIVVMPANSSKVKIAAVREYGGQVELVDTAQTSRQQRVLELSKAHPDAYVASAYDDPLVIAGNSSLGEELAALDPVPDVVVAPVGGGGLLSGIISGLARSGSKMTVIGAEPLLANDAARSLRAGEIVCNESEPQTVADGTRTLSLGKCNWEILRRGLQTIVEVPEQAILDAVRLLFNFANLKAEPTGALGVAALIAQPTLFRGARVCCVISGGNVDPLVFAEIIKD